MKCAGEMIYQRFVDGEVGLLQKFRIVSHLKKCESCREWVQCLNRENSEIALLFREDLEAPDLTQPIMEKIKSAGHRTFPGVKLLSPSLKVGLRIAAAFFLIVLFLVFLFQDRYPGQFNGEGDILIRTARVEGQAVQTHVFVSGDSDTKFIWLEKM